MSNIVIKAILIAHYKYKVYLGTLSEADPTIIGPSRDDDQGNKLLRNKQPEA